MNDECLCRLRGLYRALTAFEQQLQSQLGLNLNEVMLLCLLSKKERLLSSEIAQELGLSRSNASKVIARLEQQQLVARHQCQHDSRCQRFSLSPEGQLMLTKVHCDDLQCPEELKKLI